MKDFSKSLTSSTASILSSLSNIDELSNFTLVGGSALSIYLQHQFSEDLDFFTWLPELTNAQIDNLCNSISKQHLLKITNNYSNGVDTLIDDVRVTFFAN